MKSYVEQFLAKDEKIIVMGKRNAMGLLGTWLKFAIRLVIWVGICVALNLLTGKLLEGEGVWGQVWERLSPYLSKFLKVGVNYYLIPTNVVSIIIFFLFFLIPLMTAIFVTISYFNEEVALTNRRVLGKRGVFNTTTDDTAIGQVSACEVSRTFFGKVFNYSSISIATDSNVIDFEFLKNAEEFKKQINEQIELLQKEREKRQAILQAEEMAKVLATAQKKNDGE